ncbi:MAG: hypothetical protein ACLRSW_03075 [Christensenellaceae bacterium]
MKKQYKLNFEMVPEECWYANLRSVLPPAQWDRVRRDAYARAGGRCMICGAPASRLEAHERWSYDDKKKLQKLETVAAVCRRCHEVIHIAARRWSAGRGGDGAFHESKRLYAERISRGLGRANRLYLERIRSRLGDGSFR